MAAVPPLKTLIAGFYAALGRRDAAPMIACYHADATFSDPVFPDLDRARAQYTAATRADPSHLQAGAKLRNLTATKAAKAESESGLFGRIFRRRDS
jgi:hypothetical protein